MLARSALWLVKSLNEKILHLKSFNDFVALIGLTSIAACLKYPKLASNTIIGSISIYLLWQMILGENWATSERNGYLSVEFLCDIIFLFDAFFIVFELYLWKYDIYSRINLTEIKQVSSFCYCRFHFYYDGKEAIFKWKSAHKENWGRRSSHCELC